MVLPPVIVSVPPPTLELPLVTDRPAGSVSVKATPLRVVLEFGLVMVKVRVVVPPTRIDVGLNEAAIEGAETTLPLIVSVFELMAPSVTVPPLVEIAVMRVRVEVFAGFKRVAMFKVPVVPVPKLMVAGNEVE